MSSISTTEIKRKSNFLQGEIFSARTRQRPIHERGKNNGGKTSRRYQFHLLFIYRILQQISDSQEYDTRGTKYWSLLAVVGTWYRLRMYKDDLEDSNIIQVSETIQKSKKAAHGHERREMRLRYVTMTEKGFTLLRKLRELNEIMPLEKL